VRDHNDDSPWRVGNVLACIAIILTMLGGMLL
jgi:hypothetical protein